MRSCRSCGGPAPSEFLSLGDTPVANALIAPGAPDGPVHPLAVGICRRCALVQLTHEVPDGVLFPADYPYFSSYSDALLAHSRRHVDALVAERGLGAGSLVVEIASNDGYLLRRFVDHAVPCLGIEPCAGPAAAASAAGIETVVEFFGAGTAERLRAIRGPADVVLANNVMAHVPDLNGFVAGMAHLVADDGLVQVENPGLRYLLADVEFDTIYHEHYSYFSTLAVRTLFARHGLTLLDVEHFPELHGGTLRWTAGRSGTPTAAVEEHLAGDRAAGLDDGAVFRRFGNTVRRTQRELRRFLHRLRDDGASIAGYGAAAKGATLLNSCGIDASVIDFVVDRNPWKQGKLLPGARIPVLDPAALLERRPDYVVLLAWNYAAEVLAQQDEYRRGGGRFVVPVPAPRIV